MKMQPLIPTGSTVGLLSGATHSLRAGSTKAKRGNVIIWSGEDDAGDTIVPRLEASGADFSRVALSDAPRTARASVRSIARAISQELCEAIEARIGGAVMIVVDPIVMAIAKDTTERGNTARPATDC